jgi:hypothetical protein
VRARPQPKERQKARSRQGFTAGSADGSDRADHAQSAGWSDYADGLAEAAAKAPERGEREE